jgi:hypothetical protein
MVLSCSEACLEAGPGTAVTTEVSRTLDMFGVCVKIADGSALRISSGNRV